MYQLDAVGRLSPTSHQLSRTAAVRHAHVSALAAPDTDPCDDTPSTPRPSPRRRRPRLRFAV